MSENQVPRGRRPGEKDHIQTAREAPPVPARRSEDSNPVVQPAVRVAVSAPSVAVSATSKIPAWHYAVVVAVAVAAAVAVYLIQH